MPEIHPDDSAAGAWLGLVIGNTRLHWALFVGERLEAVWHTAHFTGEEVDRLIQQQFAAAAWQCFDLDPAISTALPPAMGALAAREQPVPLYCASVVPAQTALWQHYDGLREVTLDDVPLADCYPTLGIDRALNLLGAGDRVGWPAIVIDAGTALTFTAGVESRFVGGAILPGLQTQFAALVAKTAVLPSVKAAQTLPPRWASNTPEAMQSGVIYGCLAAMQDFVGAWQQQHPKSKAVLTGGNGAQLYQWWQQSKLSTDMVLEPDLAFWGLRCLHRQDSARGC